MDTHQCSILLVEDEPIVAHELRLSLESIGYRIIGIASSGESALSIAENERPDLALIDIRLLGPIDGIELALKLEAKYQFPIIFLTGHTDSLVIERAKALSPAGFVIKPVDTDELVAAVELGLHRFSVDKKLRAHRRWLATTLHCISDAVLTVDSRGIIQFANKSAERLIHLPEHLLVGSSINSRLVVVESATRSSLIPEITERISLPEALPITGELFEGVLIQDSDEVPIEMTIGPMRDDEDSFIGSVVVIRDVSERHRTERVRATLEQRLFQSQKMEALGQLAGGIAHDFNNLLTAILGNLSLIRQTCPAPQMKLVKATEQAGSRAAELVRQLLSFGRPSQEILELVNLESIVNEVTAVAGASLAGTAIQLHVNCDKQLPKVLADPGQLNQLVMNLFINARDAIKAKFDGIPNTTEKPLDGAIQLSIKRSNPPLHLRGSLNPHNHGCIKLTVTDSGVGISEDTKHRMFDPFFTTKPFGQGSGLGLSVVYGIVRKLHGAIEVESTVGERTCFTVYLPAAAANENHKKQAAASTIRSFRGNARILVVDQDPLVQDIVSAMLDELGYQVITCNSGRLALDILETNASDIEVLLTDAALPDMTWITLAETVHERYPAIKLLLSCHQGTPPPITNATSLRVSVLQKPYKLQDLARTIWSVVKGYYADGLVLPSPRCGAEQGEPPAPVLARRSGY